MNSRIWTCVMLKDIWTGFWKMTFCFANAMDKMGQSRNHFHLLSQTNTACAAKHSCIGKGLLDPLQRVSCGHCCLQFFMSFINSFVSFALCCFVVVFVGVFCLLFFSAPDCKKSFSKVQNNFQPTVISNCLHSFLSLWLYLLDCLFL